MEIVSSKSQEKENNENSNSERTEIRILKDEKRIVIERKNAPKKRVIGSESDPVKAPKKSRWADIKVGEEVGFCVFFSRLFPLPLEKDYDC